MISTNDFERSTRIELDGDPFVNVDYGTQSPSARSANTLVKLVVDTREARYVRRA